MPLFSLKQLHMWLLKLMKIKQKLKFSYSFALLTFPELSSHMWLVATGLDSTHVQHTHHHRKFYRKGWTRPFQYSVDFLRFESSSETRPTLIPKCIWMYCFFQRSQSRSKFHLNQRQALTASHEDH